MGRKWSFALQIESDIQEGIRCVHSVSDGCRAAYALMSDVNAVVQSQKAVYAYLTSNQIPPFGYAEQNGPVHPGSASETCFQSWANVLHVVPALRHRFEQQRMQQRL